MRDEQKISFSSVQRQKGASSFVSSVIGGTFFDKVMGSAVTEFRSNLHVKLFVLTFAPVSRI